MAQSNKRIDPYTTITDSIITALEAGVQPWRAQWVGVGGSSLRPVSGASGKVYKGINVLLCWATCQAMGYWSNTWHTYGGAKSRGGQVRKGEKSTRIVKWLFFPAKDGNGKPRIASNGEPIMIPYPKLYAVFNACQIDWEEGSEYAPGPEPTIEDHDGSVAGDTYDRAAEVLGGWSEVVTVNHGGNRACYSPMDDSIRLPKFEQFKDEGCYFSVAFHEAGHSTGHESRLDRQFGKRFGDNAYAVEELVAELTAAFLCADCGISQPEEPRADHATYLASWLKVLKKDKKAIVTAASQAERAAKLIMAASGEAAEEVDVAAK